MVQFLAQFFSKALKCMRWQHALSMCLLACAGVTPAWADHSPALSIPSVDQRQIRAQAHFWYEKSAQSTIEQVSSPSKAADFVPLMEEAMFNLMPQDRLWIRMVVERLPDSRSDDWSVWIPLPLIDTVSLHQWDQAGQKWVTRSAGDRIAVNNWPEPGRYPRFHLDLPLGTTSFYLQIQGSTPISIPVHLATELQAQQQDRLGFLGMGGIAGVLLTLVLTCMVTAYTYQDKLYGLYGLYVLLMILAVAAYTGLGGYIFWSDNPRWSDAAQGILAMLAAGGAIYFVEALLGGRQFALRLSQLLLVLSLMAVPLSMAYYLMSRSTAVMVLGIYMLIVTITGLSLAMRAWHRGDPVGQWVFFAYAPLALSVLVALARAQGWIAVSWLVQYGVVAALLIEVPMMLVALNLRSRQRHEMKMRELAMSTQDALTGLLAEHIFDDRLAQTLARYAKRREDAAVVIISLVNYPQIQAAHGLPVAEQNVLRAVIKLRKVLRDVDTVARLGTSHFGLILEGVSQRGRITEIGARLIAQGLMPLPGLRPEVTLQFHVVAAILRESAQSDNGIKSDLYALLASMSSRTRRPIRFAEPVSSLVAPMEPPALQDSGKPDDNSLNPASMH
jgi:two-component system, sensor histidine kinase LadS